MLLLNMKRIAFKLLAPSRYKARYTVANTVKLYL